MFRFNNRKVEDSVRAMLAITEAEGKRLVYRDAVSNGMNKDPIHHHPKELMINSLSKSEIVFAPFTTISTFRFSFSPSIPL